MESQRTGNTGLPPDSDIDLSVVIPLFNEEESVDALYEELCEALGGVDLRYELILVDDGSSDATGELIGEMARSDPHVRAVSFRCNSGQTAALQAGFDLAEGQVVVTMDGDLQSDPFEIPRLVEGIDEGYDVVSGWRRDRKDRAVSRRAPSLVANWLIGRVTGVRIHDNGCTLKAYRSEVVKKASLYSEMHRFLVPMLSLSGGRVKEIVVNHRPRQFGQSKYGLSRIWKVVLDLITVKMLLRFSSHPAVWFALLGVPFLMAAMVSGGLSLHFYLTSGPAAEIPIVIPAVTVLSVFASVHLLLLGMFAELVVKLGDFKETDPVLYRLLEE